jgi:DNA-binding transcriptional ArsR family regulator
LDSLFSRDGQTLNELCASSPEMTRFGVMKHLAVLEEANLVVTSRQGRTKRHYLNPVPIEQVAQLALRATGGPSRRSPGREPCP